MRFFLFHSPFAVALFAVVFLLSLLSALVWLRARRMPSAVSHLRISRLTTLAGFCSLLIYPGALQAIYSMTSILDESGGYVSEATWKRNGRSSPSRFLAFSVLSDAPVVEGEFLSPGASSCQTDAPVSYMVRLSRAFVMPPQEVVSRMESIAASSYMDTLQALFGPAKTIRVARRPPEASAQALYYRSSDEIVLYPEWDLVEFRSTLAHEMTHAWQAHAGFVLGRIWEEYDIAPMVAPGRVFYSATSRTEHQAEASANALLILRLAASKELSIASRAALIESLDAEIPGSLILARIYRSHPIFGSLRVPPLLELGLGLVPVAPPVPWSSVHPPTTGAGRGIGFFEASAGPPWGPVVRYAGSLLRRIY